MASKLSRRQMLGAAGAALGASAALGRAKGVAAADKRAAGADGGGGSFRFGLNMSTIRGQKLDAAAEIEVAGKAGYDAIEPWMGKLADYQKAGGSLKDLGKRIADLGLSVESAIGFANWIVDDDAARAKALENAKRDFDMLAQIGGKRLAAPPAGATNQSDLDLYKAAHRYRALIELGEQFGIVPEVEVWGFSKSLSRLSETSFVMIESGHPKACVLPDVYHLYRGGSDFSTLALLSSRAVHVMHMNDYPADPPRATITDAHRVYPGDGVAPLTDLLRSLRDVGSHVVLSLELFNRELWSEDALTVAKAGLRKMKLAVAKAS